MEAALERMALGGGAVCAEIDGGGGGVMEGGYVEGLAEGEEDEVLLADGDGGVDQQCQWQPQMQPSVQQQQQQPRQNHKSTASNSGAAAQPWQPNTSSGMLAAH